VFSTHKKRQSSSWSTQYCVQYTQNAPIVQLKHTIPCSAHAKSANRPAEAYNTVFSTHKKRQSPSWSTQYCVQFTQKAPIVQLKHTVPCSVHTQSFPTCASKRHKCLLQGTDLFF
jgi:hypothetical protein